MKTLYCDASFDYRHTDTTNENIVRGKICVADGEGWSKVDKVAIGKVPNLRQYINVLELTAIARAVELACEMVGHGGSIRVLTDSQVAKFWARSGKVKKKIETEAHLNALEYLKKSKLLFGGIVTFDNIPRESNPAGHILEAELLKEKPHAL